MTEPNHIHWHESGHAIVAESLGVQVNAAGETEDGGGLVLHDPCLDPHRSMTIALAGPVAESMAAGTSLADTSGWDGDMENVAAALKAMPWCNPKAAIRHATDTATRILKRRWPTVQKLAKAMASERTLYHDRIKAVTKRKKVLLIVPKSLKKCPHCDSITTEHQDRIGKTWRCARHGEIQWESTL